MFVFMMVRNWVCFILVVWIVDVENISFNFGFCFKVKYNFVYYVNWLVCSSDWC